MAPVQLRERIGITDRWRSNSSSDRASKAHSPAIEKFPPMSVTAQSALPANVTAPPDAMCAEVRKSSSRPTAIRRCPTVAAPTGGPSFREPLNGTTVIGRGAGSAGEGPRPFCRVSSKCDGFCLRATGLSRDDATDIGFGASWLRAIAQQAGARRVFTDRGSTDSRRARAGCCFLIIAAAWILCAPGGTYGGT